ncbi:hypothetical protein [Sphingobacterium sp. DR205]|uniref:hypothetical protein n=1 Tax=Sphingobacterium sp. DR205 TaxID=2713573 RepID=UPI0013E4D733|nr:hypothetical protein [Sphingobacterium sp. DR205]QIH34490.1 hypothetical protein G6053_17045 [Sphingobacterium sp. DR205]
MVNKINAFWKWFVKNANHFLPKSISNEYVELLDNEIEKFGDFGWEIGFDNKVNKNFLTISPDGDRGLFELSKTIISQSPNLEDWIFYSSKPPKQWKLIFQLLIDDEKVEFNADEWKYVLYKYPDNVYDVVIKVPISYKPYEKYFYEIGDIAVTGELGEGFVIEYVNVIELVYDFDNVVKGKDFVYLKTEILM